MSQLSPLYICRGNLLAGSVVLLPPYLHIIATALLIPRRQVPPCPLFSLTRSSQAGARISMVGTTLSPADISKLTLPPCLGRSSLLCRTYQQNLVTSGLSSCVKLANLQTLGLDWKLYLCIGKVSKSCLSLFRPFVGTIYTTQRTPTTFPSQCGTLHLLLAGFFVTVYISCNVPWSMQFVLLTRDLICSIISIAMFFYV